MKLVYLIGEPGAGKSTLLLNALPEIKRWPVNPKPFAHATGTIGDRSVAYLGRPDATFPGTDSLSMSVQPKALAWLASRPADIIVGEGDRLSTVGFLTAVPSTVVVYVCSARAQERRSQRAQTLGRPEQTGSWAKGRRTKVANIRARIHTVRLDNDADVQSASAILRNICLA